MVENGLHWVMDVTTATSAAVGDAAIATICPRRHLCAL
jgi:hypothetical protein